MKVSIRKREAKPKASPQKFLQTVAATYFVRNELSCCYDLYSNLALLSFSESAASQQQNGLPISKVIPTSKIGGWMYAARQCSLKHQMLLMEYIAFLLVACLLSTTNAAKNTLKQEETLNPTQQLVSANNKFTLGFFKPGYTNIKAPYNKRYLAIWFTNDPPKIDVHPVYIANREKPILDDSGTLTIDDTGKLVINQIGGDPIVLYPGDATSNNSRIATLQDDGNLVLQEVNTDGSTGEPLWQSFDYLADTLLPKMKLGINHRTGTNWSLTSWLDVDDPSPGPFTLEWDPKELQLIFRRRGVIFWTSGALYSNQSYQGFEHVVPDGSTFPYLMSESNTNEEFFHYSWKNIPGVSTNLANSKWWIDYRGMLLFGNRVISWYNNCYGYNTDGGCAEWKQ